MRSTTQNYKDENGRRRPKKSFAGRALFLALLALAAVWGLFRLGPLAAVPFTPNHTRVPADQRTIPLLSQTDPRWGGAPYGESDVAESGCGPTCLSMVYMGLTGDSAMTPDKMARFSQKKRYYIKGSGTSWELMTSGAEQLGLAVKALPLDEDIIRQELTAGHPIICSMKKGDFTDEGHFIVLVAYTGQGIRVNDPNSPERSQQPWSYARLQPQITALWAYQ